jgi:hypothetical protein
MPKRLESGCIGSRPADLGGVWSMERHQERIRSNTWHVAFESGRVNFTVSDNNRVAEKTATSNTTIVAGDAKSAGKWYLEFNLVAANTTISGDIQWGLANTGNDSSTYLGNYNSSVGILDRFNAITGLASGSAPLYCPSVPASCTISIAYDADAGKLWIGVDGAYTSSGDPAAGTNPNATWTPAGIGLRAAARVNDSGPTLTIPTTWAYLPSGFRGWGY